MPRQNDQLTRLIIAVTASACLLIVMIAASFILWHMAMNPGQLTQAMTSSLFPAAGGGGFALLLGSLIMVFRMLLKQERN